MSKQAKGKISQYNYIVFSITLFFTIFACLYIFFSSANIASNQIRPQIETNLRVTGDILLNPINRALSINIPLEEFSDMEGYFKTATEKFPTLSLISIEDTNKNILYAYTENTADKKEKKFKVESDGSKEKVVEESTKATFSYQSGLTPQESNAFRQDLINKFSMQHIDIKKGEETVAKLTVGIDKELIGKTLQDILYDALVVFFISLLFSLEILLFLIDYSVTTPFKRLLEATKSSSEGHFTDLINIQSKNAIGRLSKAFDALVTDIHKKYRALEAKVQKMKFDPSKKDLLTSYQKLSKKFQFSKSIEDMAKPKIKMEYIRTSFFIFILAESLAISFLPVYAKIIFEPGWGLSLNAASSIPISAFMFIFALSSPMYGGITGRLHIKKLFTVGTCITVTGMIASAVMTNILFFVIARVITALGYSLCFLSTQAYIARHKVDKANVKGIATFLGGFYSATLCGSAMGGILAANLGYQTTFWIAAILVIISAIFVYTYISDAHHEDTEQSNLSISKVFAFFKNKDFSALVWLISIPSRFIVTFTVYYLTPIYMRLEDMNQAVIGRVIMVYGFFMVILIPLVSKLLQKKPFHLQALMGGNILCGLSILPVLISPTPMGLAAAIALMGISHGIAHVPQTMAVTVVLKKECQTYGVAKIVGIYRFFEFQGYVAGPLLGSYLISKFGHTDAFIYVAGTILSIAISFALYVGLNRNSSLRKMGVS